MRLPSTRFHNLILLLAGIFMSCVLNAQIPVTPNKTDASGKRQGNWTIPLDRDRHPVSDTALAVYYRLINYQDDVPSGLTREYYRNKNLAFTATLVQDRPAELWKGTATWYNETGVKEAENVFSHGHLYKTAAVYFYIDGSVIKDSRESLTSNGLLLYNAGKVDEALPFYDKMLIRAKHELNRESPDYIQVLENTADIYYGAKDYSKVESMHVEIKAIRERILGKDHPDYLNSLSALTFLYKNARNYRKAEPLCLEAKAIRERTLGKDHPDYLTSLNDLTWIYYNLPDYAKAEPLFVEVVEFVARKQGKAHPDYANALNNLAALYADMDIYSKAEPLNIEAMKIWAKVLGTESEEYAVSVHNLASFYVDMGHFSKSEALFLEAKAIRLKALGKEHPDYASTLNSLAILYQTMGSYAQAESLFLEAREIRAKALGKEDLNYASTLNNLAGLYKEMGNYSGAFPLFVEALQIRRKILGDEHPVYAGSLNNLADLAREVGRDSIALPLFIEAKEIFIKTLGKENQQYATTLNNLGSLYQDQRDYSKAEPYYVESLEIMKKISGAQHPDYARCLHNLGGLYEDMGDYPKAERLYVEAKSIWEKVLGKEHPLYALSLNELSELYETMGDLEKAEPLYVAQIAIIQRQLLRYFPSLSEKEKQDYYAFNLPYVSGFEQFCVERQMKKPAILSELYNLKLATKGLLFSASNKIRRRILASNNQALIAQFNQWQSKRDFLAKVYKMTIEEKQKNGLDEKKLEEEANAIEKELSLKSELFREVSGKTLPTWNDVRAKLKPGEVAIEMVRTLKKTNGKYVGVYVALIVTPQTQSQPAIVILENAVDLENKFSRFYRNAMKQKIKDEVSYSQYWKPIADKIKGAKKVYFSAEGIYNQINLNTLYNTASQKYLIDELDVEMVTSTKDLLAKNKTAKAQIKDATLFGYPNYNNYQQVRPDFDPTLLNKVISNLPALASDSSQRFFNGENITELPGTKVEVQTIEALIKNKNIAMRQFLFDDATEAAVKKLNNPQVLHIATHGFFLSDLAAPKENERGFGGMDIQKFFDNPLLRSGLLFAGAKNSFKPNAGAMQEEDGILNAYEAMNLDLDQTDLVVLSACETGLGVTRNGEGVYGLQRAFQVAGAKSVLMSLWTVSDEATQKLMTQFYENWLGGKPPREAFKAAQLALREKYPEPYYWGAFVLVGINLRTLY